DLNGHPFTWETPRFSFSNPGEPYHEHNQITHGESTSPPISALLTSFSIPSQHNYHNAFKNTIPMRIQAPSMIIIYTY
ncbi:unnamed protein product, partial [Allacma fusca]